MSVVALVTLLLVLLVSGYKERTISLARKPTLPVHTNDKYKDFYGGYHDGAVAADNDDSRQKGFHSCPTAGHSQQY